jgi:hypothetical protein
MEFAPADDAARAELGFPNPTNPNHANAYNQSFVFIVLPSVAPI